MAPSAAADPGRGRSARSQDGATGAVPPNFFLVTNWEPSERTASDLLAHYRRRGTFEDRLGELSQAIAPRLSSPLFVENEVHFLLSLLSMRKT